MAPAVRKIRRREIIGQVDGQRAVVGYLVEVEMHDNVQPLRLLGLEVGMFTEKFEQSGDDASLRALREGRERALALAVQMIEHALAGANGMELVSMEIVGSESKAKPDTTSYTLQGKIPPPKANDDKAE